MKARNLIQIDRLFFLPYKILRNFVTAFGPTTGPPRGEGPVLIIKFMGMGSITRFASLCNELQINRNHLVLITFAGQLEICRLLGFGQCWFIRTSGVIAFISDCLKIIVRSWKVRPSVIVDYERCSYAVGVFRFILGWRTNASLVCFENIDADFLCGRLTAFSIRKINLVTMFKLGLRNCVGAGSLVTEHLIEMNGQRVIVNCNASNYLLARRYPADGFVHLIEMLQGASPELEFYFTGSESEFDYVEEIVDKLRAKEIRVSNMSGKWSIEQLCDALVACRMFITCDSGPLHLAAMLGVPTLAIWGPTQAEQFGYENYPHIKNVSVRMSCAPCLSHPYSAVAIACRGEITCMKTLPVERLFSTSIEMLSAKAMTRKAAVLPGRIATKDRELQPQSA